MVASFGLAFLVFLKEASLEMVATFEVLSLETNLPMIAI
jgi:hypothetical protein